MISSSVKDRPKIFPLQLYVSSCWHIMAYGRLPTVIITNAHPPRIRWSRPVFHGRVIQACIHPCHRHCLSRRGDSSSHCLLRLQHSRNWLPGEQPCSLLRLIRLKRFCRTEKTRRTIVGIPNAVSSSITCHVAKKKTRICFYFFRSQRNHKDSARCARSVRFRGDKDCEEECLAGIKNLDIASYVDI